MKILVLNSGSSSLKYQLINVETGEVVGKGLAERIGVKGAQGASLTFQAKGRPAQTISADMPDHDEAMRIVFRALTDPDSGAIRDICEISAVGHRVVHGGERFVQPTLVTEETLQEIDAVSELAPLHNPPNLAGIKACRRTMPDVPQVAVFDTAFFAPIPKKAYLYALPYNLYEDYGVRRYGFHGTSHRYVTTRARKLLGEAGMDVTNIKIVSCHLGNGCSASAVVGDKPIDTSLGMTPAEGLVMGTRGGDMDPAIIPFLMRRTGMTPDDIDDLINKKSGLLGVSGISSDMRDIEAKAADGDTRAALAFEIFCYRVRKYIGAYAAAMGGLNTIVFTGGIGENGPEVRERICQGLEFLGVEIDADKNAGFRGEGDISVQSGRVRIMVIPTDEEMMIARETAGVVSDLLAPAAH
jgi:acetate kinase